MRHLVAISLLAVTMLLPVRGSAVEPVPFPEIVTTVRDLAAAQLHKKPSDIDVTTTLASQGCTEQDLQELVVAINQEFGVVIPDSDVEEGKRHDPVPPMSVRRLAELVDRQMHPRY